MKKIVSFLIYFNCIFFNLYAQDLSENIFQFKVSLYDTSNNFFFTNHPDIPQIKIQYNKSKAVALYIFHKTDSILYKKTYVPYIIEESYDLGFLGDTYLFAKKYKDLKFSVIPGLVKDKINNLPKCKQSGSRWLSSVISKDSVIYVFKQQCDPGRGDVAFRPPGIGLPPKYAEDINYLIRNIENYKAKQELTVQDSTLVFGGEISRNGVLTNLKLLAGDKSPFSAFVKKQIAKPENKWIPADISGRKMNSYIRIYMNLNPEGNIKIATPQKLLIASGK